MKAFTINRIDVARRAPADVRGSEDVSFFNKTLFAIGGISSEILSKVLRCRMSGIVSAGAPANQAVKLVHRANLTA